MTDKLLPLPEPNDACHPDTFRGDDAALVSCINALLELDAKNALVPHGIGGHARTLLSSASARLTAHLAAQQAEPVVDELANEKKARQAAQNQLYEERERHAKTYKELMKLKTHLMNGNHA